MTQGVKVSLVSLEKMEYLEEEVHPGKMVRREKKEKWELAVLEEPDLLANLV